jgi:hypothetical protein
VQLLASTHAALVMLSPAQIVDLEAEVRPGGVCTRFADRRPSRALSACVDKWQRFSTVAMLREYGAQDRDLALLADVDEIARPEVSIEYACS